MHFVGLDLAWGEVQPTGIAVLDAAGRLVHVAAALDDAAIQAELGRFVEGDCLVAIDAPLVVTNSTGQRRCEAALNRDFGAFHAGAHSSNTANPVFAGTPRGARLAEILGLDIDPESLKPRRAIEVYPHPATVALFGLGRTLKYKGKPGRSVDRMRSELLRLMGFVEDRAQGDVRMRVAEHPG
jgi:predicted RNase H-like nuclease